MKIEAVKQNGHFVIPYLDNLDLSLDKIDIIIDDAILENKKNDKSETYKKLEKLNTQLGGNEFLQLKLKNTPKDYEYKHSDKNDREIWFEAVKNKYEL